jgi:hypothetical protein
MNDSARVEAARQELTAGGYGWVDDLTLRAALAAADRELIAMLGEAARSETIKAVRAALGAS